MSAIREAELALWDAILTGEPIAEPVVLVSNFGRVTVTEVEEGWRIDGEAAHYRAKHPFRAEIGRCRCDRPKCKNIGHSDRVVAFSKKVLRTYR